VPDLVETESYTGLVADLKDLIAKGQQAALAAVNEIKVATYWEMGKRMSELKELADPEQAAGLVPRLAEDLGLDPTLVYRIMQFYRLWPEAVPKVEEAPQLSWTHYVELLSIKDEKERNFYLQQAAMEEWSRDTLRKAIQKDFFTLRKSPKKLKSGQTTLERGGDPLHIYKAIVEKVVDGDTLLVRIDLGFEVWVSQRVRFRGINTAELVKAGVATGKAPERGEKAMAFVEETLKGIEFVVIKTYKTDIYGRYVADVFYHPTIKRKEDVYKEGFFLNVQLLAEGLADPMS
jgi:endonuclease YncB( thermonuclease family)